MRAASQYDNVLGFIVFSVGDRERGGVGAASECHCGAIGCKALQRTGRSLVGSEEPIA
jgi:hypothetical protein